MDKLFAEKRDMPPSVPPASALTLFLAVYAAATAGPGCIVGLFVGPHILIPALVFAASRPFCSSHNVAWCIEGAGRGGC